MKTRHTSRDLKRLDKGLTCKLQARKAQEGDHPSASTGCKELRLGLRCDWPQCEMRAKRSKIAECLKKARNQPARECVYGIHTVALLHVFKTHFVKKRDEEILGVGKADLENTSRLVMAPPVTNRDKLFPHAARPTRSLGRLSNPANQTDRLCQPYIVPSESSEVAEFVPELWPCHPFPCKFSRVGSPGFRRPRYPYSCSQYSSL